MCSNVWRHMGSVAFGALIVAIVEAIKLVFDYLHAKLKETSGAGSNKAVGCILSCIGCCLSCFERFIRFINRHAYIQIAMTGENFCKAAEESFFLIMRFWAQLGVVHGIGEVFVGIGTLFITVLSTMVGYLIITKTSLNQDILSPFAPTLVFFFISYVVGHNFMSIYGMSADTIIHCFCMDEEIHEKEGGAQHAPELLRSFIHEHKGKNELNAPLASPQQ